MNISFNLPYNTAFGEELLVNVQCTAASGSLLPPAAYRMTTVDGRQWRYRLTLSDDDKVASVDYHYSVEDHGRETRHEWLSARHRLELNAARCPGYEVFDRWRDLPDDAYLYSSAFTDCVHRRLIQRPSGSHFRQTVRVKVQAPQLPSGYRLMMTGDSTSLGAWNVRRALRMTEHTVNEWQADLCGSADGDKAALVEFKFVAVRESSDEVLWETCANRTLDLTAEEGRTRVYELGQAFFPLPDTRIAGMLVPVFSLRTDGSQGIGDFGDLASMVAFVASTGGRVLQILPINDTTTDRRWTDSYPYNAVSIFALHPIYADLRQLPAIKDRREAARYEARRKELNALKQIDYEQVIALKESYLRKTFALEGAKDMATAGYAAFAAANNFWLDAYARFCVRRDTPATAPAEAPAVEYYYWVQYVLSRQLAAAHDKARRSGVILKGDIPIGVNRYGADVIAEPRYFNLDGQAGAPPDDFSVKGQNWGFPTYNWDEMLADGCQWWVRRFANMSQYFDAYRIDHVLGFFRIWEIPSDCVHGLLGQFSPSLGLSRQEIEAYGLKFREQAFTEPFIADWSLDRTFGPRAAEVKAKYLVQSGEGRWRLRPEWATERKIEAAFAAAYPNGDMPEAEAHLRDGLYSLVSCVLFVRDKSNPQLYHPRITAQLDFMYESLAEADRASFNRLYDDYYYRRNNHFWYSEAMKKLPRLVEATRMLVCAEDLGMVPECVAWVMGRLKILSLEIQSMPKNPGLRFGQVSHNPYRSVCTLFSHDMPTLRQWWDEDDSRTQDYYTTVLHRSGAAPHPLPGWLARDIVRDQLLSPSMLCVLSIQDWLSIDDNLRLPDANAERINIPANPRHYWRYRMHVPIEDLMANESYKANVRELIDQAGR